MSEARGGSASADGTTAASLQLAYVALPPGSLPTVETARIRNLAGSAPGVTVPVIDGGFDPVPIPAAAGDQLELTLMHSTGAVSVAYARVPAKRPPVVVRTFPSKGRTDVALRTIPTVIFSEPIDASTLATGVRLFRGDEEVTVVVETAADLWEARVVPAAQLEPGTDYELRITSEVRDLEGDSLETSLNIPFRTEAVSPALASWGNSRIAFDRLRTTHNPQIFLGQPDGTIAPLRDSGDDVCDTRSGWVPRLSPDGTSLLFLIGGMSPDYICVIDLDGSNDRRFDWGLAAWSADGTRILSAEGKMVGGDHRWELYTINADGSGAKRLLSNSLPSGIEDLDVSPDGTIAFGTSDGKIWLMHGEGSSLRRVGDTRAKYDPRWSPDGARIAYVANSSRGTIGSMAADGSDARIHFQTAAGERAFGAEWSPDGRSIAFSIFGSTGGGTGIHVVNLESGTGARLVDGEAWQFSWAAVKP
ncbi:MAG TPA: Ig-like domain-containing protein [Gemmatimonadaceae bacterium]|nr:Ig-like domain-containing protein [Gemmatimonadaceae bacterium]